MAVARLHQGQGGTGPLRLMAGPLNQMRQNNFLVGKEEKKITYTGQ